MQITLKQSHVEAAIRDYVAKAGITFPVDDINFTAGRGKDGLTATVEMEDPFAVDAAPSPASAGKTVKVEKTEPAFTSSAAASVKAKPEPVEEAVEEEDTAEPEEEPTPAVEEEKDEQPVSKQAPPFAQEEDEPAPQPKKEKVNLFG